ncbi:MULTISPECIES: outer membrane protein [Methylosinus]|uniref:Porin family protein n=1 Tax=Methylosinus trichosporium (strain ATCC 35070 / NCIMB 11131 / UNIQEM 75 / OB3b) TaxID=595536 RepID=A0A2D2D676_METT3|nr:MULTISPECIES: outer membrane beta-barrel protein [Methylosinus]ATQ70465.1 porin family protein [Methylosinus trichosporium OB3b]OBS51968.1 porin [Methylosinus sp. 3S-1]
MNIKFSALAVAAALVAGSAAAADLPSRKEAPVFVPPPVFSWTGPYVGLNLGGSWITRNNDWNNWGGWGWNNNNSGSNGGVSGGLQIGYNYQLSPMFVVGLETDFQGTSIGGGNNNNNWWGYGGVGWSNWWNNNNNERVPWFGTVRGRLGVALLDSRLLIYGTGGFGYGEVNRNDLFSWWGGNNGQLRTGWTAGGGIEWAFLPNWSAKIEYLYTELDNNNNNNNGAWLLAALPGYNPAVVGLGAWAWNNRHRTQINTVRAGVNYHFNLFTPAPVVARY